MELNKISDKFLNRIQIVLVIALIFILIFISGCKSVKDTREESRGFAISKCKEICLKARQEINLSSQCLSDLYVKDWVGKTLDSWVCDVAHWPRKSIDDMPKNQCQSFRHGKAKHFVEVDEECNFIRAI